MFEIIAQNAALIFAVLTVGAIVTFACYTLIRLRLLKNAIASRDTILEKLNNDIRALTAGAAGITEHVGRLEQQLRRVSERQNSMDLRDSGAQSYDYAMRLARRGAGVDELVKQCGLIREEAELLVRMYGLEKAS
jgi:hypothetical protein